MRTTAWCRRALAVGAVWLAVALLTPGEAAAQVFGTCYYSLSSSSADAEARGDSGSFTVGWHYEPDPGFPGEEDESVCADAWGASSQVSWISVSESRPDTVNYTVDANPKTTERDGTIRAAGETFTVAQSGLQCGDSPDSVSPSSVHFGAGDGSSTVTAGPTACSTQWVVTDTEDWIDSPSTVSSDGSVTIKVRSNPGDTRSGTVRIGRASVTVTQDAAACPSSPSVDPSSLSFDSGSSSQRVEVGGGAHCSYAVSDDRGWMGTSSSVSGGDWVTVSVLANPSCADRTGTVDIGGTPVPVTQSGKSPGPPSASPSSLTFGSGGGESSVTAGDDSSCTYAVSDNRSWISTDVSSVSGTNSVRVSVLPNPTCADRTGTVDIGGTSVDVTQSGASPGSPLVSPSSLSFGSGGGKSSVTVGDDASCTYAVSDNRSWISTDVSSVSGDGDVTISVEANDGDWRSGTVSIGGTRVRVTQDGETCSTSPSVSPSSLTFAGGGGALSVGVGDGSHCSFTVSDDREWITTDVSSVSGGGSVTVTASAHGSGAERSGTVRIGGSSVEVWQCPSSPTLSPSSLSFGNGSGSSEVDVAGSSRCSHSVSTAAAWVTLGVSSVSGGASVTVTVSANEDDARSGAVLIGGGSVSVTQAAGACPAIPVVDPSSLTVSAAAGSSPVTVGGGSHCGPYAVTADQSWLTALPASVSGAGTVTVSVTENSAEASRTGTVTVGGASVSVTQSAPCPAGPTGFSLGERLKVGASGANLVLTTVLGRSDCTWSTAATVTWVEVLSSSTQRRGGQSLRLRVLSNAGGLRWGTVTVGTTVLPVIQGAAAASVAPWTDAVLTAGETPIRAVHMRELRTRANGVQEACGVSVSAWTDAVLTAGETPVKAVHMRELRAAVESARTACGGAAPGWTDAVLTAGETPIRAVHVTELRAAVEALERAE